MVKKLCLCESGERGRLQGTVSRGIRMPMIQPGDDLVDIVVEGIIESSYVDGYTLHNKDIVGVTESLLARSQGNLVKMEDLRDEFNDKFPGDTIGVLYPIFSRNRFLNILEALSLTGKDIVVMLDYPYDEVGNPIMSPEQELACRSKLDSSAVYTGTRFREYTGEYLHEFTRVDYIELYESVRNVEVVLSKNPLNILDYTDNILVSNVHGRDLLKDYISTHNVGGVTLGLGDILTKPRYEGCGYNEEYGIMGSNLSKLGEVKLFPRGSQEFVEAVQSEFKSRTGLDIEVLVFGDGAFKDPVAGIWELADPVVCPGYTSGLLGEPEEIKLKFILDNVDLEGEELDEHMEAVISEGGEGTSDCVGTTPRQITDLVGSLCDLTCGSGDKGTPVVLVQGYFDKYTDSWRV